jgi:hypothetical protein
MASPGRRGPPRGRYPRADAITFRIGGSHDPPRRAVRGRCRHGRRLGVGLRPRQWTLPPGLVEAREPVCGGDAGPDITADATGLTLFATVWRADIAFGRGGKDEPG